ncbi:MAG: FixH family protein [Bacteroidetes bacterium]|nr:FixH family protein [Bacteroidota bacterium]
MKTNPPQKTNKPKPIWAYGIIAVFIIFATLMVSFAIVASKHKSNLVITDYYKAEIEFQQQINKADNYSHLAVKPLIYYDSAAQNLSIKWNRDITNKPIIGYLTLYRPNDPSKDVKFSLTSAEFSIPSSLLKKGKYLAKLDWAMEGKSYYHQQIIMVK